MSLMYYLNHQLKCLIFCTPKEKKNKFLLFEICNDIYFIKHRCKYALIRFQMFFKYFFNESHLHFSWI